MPPYARDPIRQNIFASLKDVLGGIFLPFKVMKLGGGPIVSQTKSANYTMTEADSGKTTYIDTDGVVITLPAAGAGIFYNYRFVNVGEDGQVGFSISPNAADKIMGIGLTSADNKDLINTKATAKKGDTVEIFGDGVNGWIVSYAAGQFDREA